MSLILPDPDFLLYRSWFGQNPQFFFFNYEWYVCNFVLCGWWWSCDYWYLGKKFSSRGIDNHTRHTFLYNGQCTWDSVSFMTVAWRQQTFFTSYTVKHNVKLSIFIPKYVSQIGQIISQNISSNSHVNVFKCQWITLNTHSSHCVIKLWVRLFKWFCVLCEYKSNPVIANNRTPNPSISNIIR